MVFDRQNKSNKESDSEILRHINTISIIVHKYCSLGMIAFHELKDYEQEVTERLIRKMPKIKRSYNGSVKFETYLSVIINNLCKELIRSGKISGRKHFHYMQDAVVSRFSVTGGILIDDEKKRLQKVFILFGKKRPKLEISLKTYFNINFVREEINSMDKALAELLLEINRKNEELIKDKGGRYEILTSFFNIQYGENNNQDAIRKWIKSRIREIIILMNGNPKRSNYNEETLGILLDNYYEDLFIKNLTKTAKDDQSIR